MQHKESSKLFRVSSNATIFLRLAFPISWIAFFASFGLIFLILKDDEVPMFQNPAFKLGYLAFFIIGVLFLYFTLMQLKRVDMSRDNFFVTNYFKTYKYTYQSISNVNEINFFLFKVVVLRLKEKGNFGNKIKFISSRKLWDEFFYSNPDLFKNAV